MALLALPLVIGKHSLAIALLLMGTDLSRRKYLSTS